jgi:hypothetical protein
MENFKKEKKENTLPSIKTNESAENFSSLDRIIKKNNGLKKYLEREQQIRVWEKQEKAFTKVGDGDNKSKSISEFIEKRTGQKYDVEVLTRDVYKIKINPNDFKFPDLPEGYGINGGAARAALEKVLGLSQIHEFRDLDIVFSGESEDPEVSNRVSEEFMPDDFSHGYGVSNFNQDYFESRDFTINEVYYQNNALFFTKNCIFDMLRGKVKVTDFEKEESYDGHPYFVKPKLLAKALRFVGDRQDSNPKTHFANEEVFEWQGIDSFHMALHLDRSLESGHSSAMKYISKLKEQELIPDSLETPLEVAEYLKDDTNFEFRFLPTLELNKVEFIQKKKEIEPDEEKYSEFEDFSPKRESFGK